MGVRIFLSTQAPSIATPPTLIWGVQWACCVSAFEYIVHVRYPVLFSSRHPTLLEKSRGGPPEEADEEGKEMEGGDQRIGRGGEGSESALLGTPSRSSAVLGTLRHASATLKSLRTPRHSLALPCCAKPCYPLLSLQSPATPCETGQERSKRGADGFETAQNARRTPNEAIKRTPRGR